MAHFCVERPLAPELVISAAEKAIAETHTNAPIQAVGIGQKPVDFNLVNKVVTVDQTAFELKQSGGGWQFLTKKEYHKTIAQLNGDKFLKRLSSAALETLSIIAYKQPVTKGEIESIRGVSSDYAVQKLLEKELIIISGRNEKMPGHPLVYCTSRNFMDYFGINSADDLPKIKEVLADQLVEPTVIKDTKITEEDPKQSNTDDEVLLSVTEEGELEVSTNPS